MVRESESKATAGVEQGSGDTACFVYDKSTCLSGMIWNCYLLSVCPVGFAIRRLILLFCRSRGYHRYTSTYLGIGQDLGCQLDSFPDSTGHYLWMYGLLVSGL